MCDRTCKRQPWRPWRRTTASAAPRSAHGWPPLARPRGAPVLGKARDRAHELLVPARAGLPELPRRGGQRAQGGEQRPQHGRLLVPLRSTCVHLDARRSLAVTQQQAAAAERKVKTALARAAQVHRVVTSQRTSGVPRCRFRVRAHYGGEHAAGKERRSEGARSARAAAWAHAAAARRSARRARSPPARPARPRERSRCSCATSCLQTRLRAPAAQRQGRIGLLARTAAWATGGQLYAAPAAYAKASHHGTRA
jgi:hypothetical protein